MNQLKIAKELAVLHGKSQQFFTLYALHCTKNSPARSLRIALNQLGLLRQFNKEFAHAATYSDC